METPIDESSRNTWSAMNESTGLIEPVLCDPVSNAIYVYGVADSAGTYTALDRAFIDENGRNTMTAWNDDTSMVDALRCSDEGYILVYPV